MASQVAGLGEGTENSESWERGVVPEGMMCRRLEASGREELSLIEAPDQLSEALVVRAG